MIADTPPSLFFCSGAWGVVFQIGVYKSLVEKWGYEKLSKVRIGGNSAGAIIAIAVALGITWEELENIYKEMAMQAIRYGVWGKVTEYHIQMLNKIIKNKDDYKKLNNRLYIGVTYFIDKYELISEWNNNQELIDTLHASFHIPFYCSYIKKINNRMAIDGAFGKTYQKFSEPTLVINQCTDIGDITCKPPLSLKDCYKPGNETTYKYIFYKGYMAMNNWDNIYKTYPIIKKYKLFILLMWLLRYMESLKMWCIW